MSSPPPRGVVLDLSDACIETAAKRRYDDVRNCLLADPASDPALEAELELLVRFLESTDFGALRSAHPELRGGPGTRVVVCDHPQSGVTWEVAWGCGVSPKEMSHV